MWWVDCPAKRSKSNFSHSSVSTFCFGSSLKLITFIVLLKCGQSWGPLIGASRWLYGVGWIRWTKTKKKIHSERHEWCGKLSFSIQKNLNQIRRTDRESHCLLEFRSLITVLPFVHKPSAKKIQRRRIRRKFHSNFLKIKFKLNPASR